MTTLKEMIEAKGITMEVTRATHNPNMDGDMFHWNVTLKNGEKEMTTTFSTGAGWVQPKKAIQPTPYVNRNAIQQAQKQSVHYNFKAGRYEPMFMRSGNVADMEAIQRAFEPKPPTVDDVLECLLSDSDVSDFDSFEDWAPELGYDTDSIKAKKIYEACQTQTSKLRKFLGSDFDAMREAERG